MANVSHTDDLDPDSVGRREFTRSRRGFDQIEVRAFLNSVAAQLRTERQRQVDLTRKLADAERRATRSKAADAQRMTTVLGEETAKIIEAAREAAEEMRERAESESAAMREDASRLLAEATEEANALLEHARADATAARDEATTEAMAEVEQAKDRAREMVEEARAHRERVVQDVAKRRKALRAQYQVLAGVRDQMIERLDASQGHLSGAIDAVRRALSEDPELGRSVESPAHEEDLDEAELTPADDDRVFHRVRMPAPPTDPDPVESEVAVVEADEAESAETAVEAAETAAESAETAADGSEDVDSLFAQLRAESRSEEAAETDGDPAEAGAEVVDLRSESAENASGSTEAGSTEAGSTEAGSTKEEEDTPIDPLADPFAARDRALEPLDRALRRRLKRVLADDQNAVLDRLRTVRGKPTPERILSELDDLGRAASGASRSELADAHRTGGEHLGGGDHVAVFDDLDEVFRSQIAEPLRAEVAALLEDSDDVEELSERVRAGYRTYRTEQLPAVSAHLVAAAYARGRFDAIDDGADVVWLQDPGASSPDCEDNELAGVVKKGTVFPTGAECAPAYEGCRCLVIPAAMAPAPTEA